MEFNNIKEFRSNYLTGSTKIPDSLKQNQYLRYVLIKRREKKPSERGWQRESNYTKDNPRLLGHLAAGGNYGVACGFGDLIVVDIDEEERLNELGVIDKLPKTFTVRTGGGGSHRYYYCPELQYRITLWDPVLKNKEKPEVPLHLGEIQSKGQQVVGPGSTHPNGNVYDVIVDLPIAKISLTELMDAIKDLRTTTRDKTKGQQSKKRIKAKKKEEYIVYGSLNNIIKIANIAMPFDVVNDDGTEIQGSHPIHGSYSGKNFSINPAKNTWHCFRCDSGGGPFEWLAVKAGLISCEEARPGCLRGKLFRQVLEIARDLGYKIPDRNQSLGQVNLIKNRIIVDDLPEDLQSEPVIVIKGPPRIGKTYWAAKQLVKAGEGNYITHRHSIVKHALDVFHKEGGQYVVWLEGKHRRGMCRKEMPNCMNCEFCPHERQSYMEYKDIASKLLLQHKILTKEQIPSDLCPYYVLKLAEESANYCFTVVNFIEDIKQRSLTVLDEDPTLAYFNPASIELFRFKKEKNKYKIDNTLGEALDQAPLIRNAISEKERSREEDKALLWAIDTLGGLNEVIKTTISGRSDPMQCYQQMAKELASTECSFTSDIKERALKKLEDYHIQDSNSENDIKQFVASILYTYKKKSLLQVLSSGSGYSSVYLIGDASAPVINTHWTDTAKGPGHKILIIGNTMAELFGKSLGNAVVIEIQEFKYRRNYVVVPIDSSNEDTYRGEAKKQRLKVRKIIKAVADDPDSDKRRPLMALVGSKAHQEWLMRSLGGITHASQEEGETGQQWNYRGGYVNIIYQNSMVSRGLDVDLYNVICVHDSDFIQPFRLAAIEAGEENADAILNSIQMDETTNSVLRISPVVGRNELQPKIIIIPREDLWKVRYLDDQVLGEKEGGRTPDIKHIAGVIRKNNLTGTAQLSDSGTSSDGTLPDGWEEAVKECKLVDYFKLELNRLKEKGNFTEEEIADAKGRVLKVLKKAKKDNGLSISGIRKNGLKCNDALLRIAMETLYYEGKIRKFKGNRKLHWSLK